MLRRNIKYNKGTGNDWWCEVDLLDKVAHGGDIGAEI